MSMISSVGQNVVRSAATAGAKYLKVAPTTTKMVYGVPIKTNHVTGTQVTKMADGAKNIILGAGNKLSKLFGEGANILSYPKGHMFGGEEGMIFLNGKAKKGVGLPFTPKEFGEFVNLMKSLAKIK